MRTRNKKNIEVEKEKKQEIIPLQNKKIKKKQNKPIKGKNNLSLPGISNNQEQLQQLMEGIKSPVSNNSGDGIIIKPSQFVQKQQGLQNSFISLYFLGHFDRKYEMKELLGHGGCGQVYKVIHKTDKQIRAMKILFKNKMLESNGQQFLREVELQKKLDHPNIVKVYEFFEDQDNFYLINEFVDGKELLDEISNRDSFTEVQAAQIMQQILQAVAYLHKNQLIHRDIKLDNILLVSDKKQAKLENFVVKLIDFGYSAEISNKEDLLQQCGTIDYNAPEVFNGSYDEKRDIWSIGVVMYSILGMSHPFQVFSTNEASSISKTMDKIKIGQFNLNTKYFKNVSDEAKDLINKLLVYDYKVRISAQQALSHPWFKNQIQEPKNDKVCKLDLNRMKQFRAGSKLQQATLQFIAHQLLSDTEKLDMQSTFKRLDTNNDGQLSVQELINGLQDIFKLSKIQALNQAQKIFEQADMDRSGFIDYNEFITATMINKQNIEETKLQAAFSIFDKDNNGFISIEEIKQVIGLQNEAQGIGETFWTELIDEIDVDKDGQISFHEFKQFMMKKVKD